jgi:hypothetical protein
MYDSKYLSGLMDALPWAHACGAILLINASNYDLVLIYRPFDVFQFSILGLSCTCVHALFDSFSPLPIGNKAPVRLPRIVKGLANRHK